MERATPFNRSGWKPNQELHPKTEQAGFYRFLTQAGQTANFINFHFKDGNQKALPTASMSCLAFTPGKGMITILCGYASVAIAGRNLEELYRKLLTLSITEIREFNEEESTPKEQACFITGIAFESSLSTF